VALEDKEAVGFAAYRVSEDEGCELVSLASKYPGMSIGTALVDEIRDKYDVWVVADRKAEKFYEKLGFVQIDKRIGASVRQVKKVYQWSQ
jgi:N-acetylglutamate synthase-like GNAT family acetyltransferase